MRQVRLGRCRRLDELEASGQLDRLLRSVARLVQQAMVLEAARNDAAPAVAVLVLLQDAADLPIHDRRIEAPLQVRDVGGEAPQCHFNEPAELVVAREQVSFTLTPS